MKIISFNINGLRSGLQKGFLEWLKKEQPDIICLQEVKFDTPEHLNPLFEGLGYTYTHWYPAQKKGYSGVAILAKQPALQIIQGSGMEEYDIEGRILRFDTKKFSLINVYVPSGTSGEIRQSFKMKWLDHFKQYVVSIQQEQNKPLILCGDFNIAHQEIDIHNPKANQKSTGFLPEERQWVSEFLEAGFVDTFRYKNPQKQQYSWWTYRANARAKNLGWRIDYFFASRSIEANIQEAELLTDICFSDHCPIMIKLEV
ncbi:exodeoxyribonuclease III [Xanthocytophaga agilis]|uniref:Exodeoxyribonuclease III n=1 Tax=Xanthocytophaga agilis TaxID=3048010 RepID=A0AAE3R6Q7_9BACT|nr:exodeoxyribonuclease III [Xanthocytophaga agilis]MDJ1502617.1 exodeoxyribonuclease III [Xanthocytophaga agilis]